MTECNADGCESSPKKRGLCQRHYSAARRAGTLKPLPRLSIEDRFWSKVEKTETCWLWRGTMHYSGYGYFAPTPRTMVRAHRMAYELAVGPIPDGLTIDHLCRVKNCVNPSHMEPVTAAENTRRVVRPTGPQPERRLTTCRRGHNDWSSWIGGDGKEKRQCRICHEQRREARGRDEEYAREQGRRDQRHWAQVRTWARNNGFKVGKQGPLANAVIAAYRQATEESE